VFFLATMISNLIHRVREHLRRPDVRKKAFAESAGLHPNTLAGVERDDWNPTAGTLLALERELEKVEAAHGQVSTAGHCAPETGSAEKISEFGEGHPFPARMTAESCL
jgi:hypothetical protein